MNQTIKLILIAGFMLLALQLCSAEIQSLGVFKSGECLSLKQVCANCSFSNVTSVYSPTSIQLMGNHKMTKLSTEYNYTFCNTTELGQYIVNGVSDVDGENTVWAYDFEITTTGIAGGIIPLLIFLFVGACIFLILSISFENYLLGYLSGILFIIAGICVMIYGIGTIADLYTRVIAVVSIGIGIAILLIAAYEQLEYAEFGGGSEEE